MADDSFLLISLKESKAKKLAQVIGNDTCRKILDYLSKKNEATETEISKDLVLPISTVHYNLQHLYKSKLVEAEEFHYSEKGKEVNHYKLANKLIIIAPKESDDLKGKLRRIFPIMGLAVLATGAITFFRNVFVGGSSISPLSFSKSLADKAMMDVVDTSSAEMIRQAAPLMQTTTSHIPSTTLALWFLFGAIFTLISYLIWDYILKKRDK